MTFQPSSTTVVRVALAVSCTLSACVDSLTRSQGSPRQGFRIGLIDQDNDKPVTLDGEFLEIERKVPGFAGLFQDGQRLVVLLTEPTEQGNVAKAEIPSLVLNSQTELRRFASLPIEIRPARYRFSALQAWRTAVDSVWVTGLVFTDVDERANQAAFGVSSTAALGQLTELLHRLGVPQEGFQITLVPHSEPLLDSLAGYVRPTLSGLQIVLSVGGGASFKFCTLGANITGGVPGANFVTASHCSQRMLGLDDSSGNTWYQPVPFYSLSNIEGKDPAPFTGGACPSGKVCRYSDATIIRYASPDEWGGAFLAVPVNTTYPWEFVFRLRFDQTITGVTNYIYKVGRTTGYTQGSSYQTCATYAPDSATYQTKGVTIPSNLLFLCQNSSQDLPVDGGDSGAAVWATPYYDPLWSATVLFLGILHAGGSGSLKWYSPAASIKNDLGATIRWDVY